MSAGARPCSRFPVPLSQPSVSDPCSVLRVGVGVPGSGGSISGWSEEIAKPLSPLPSNDDPGGPARFIRPSHMFPRILITLWPAPFTDEQTEALHGSSDPPKITHLAELVTGSLGRGGSTWDGPGQTQLFGEAGKLCFPQAGPASCSDPGAAQQGPPQPPALGQDSSCFLFPQVLAQTRAQGVGPLACTCSSGS